MDLRGYVPSFKDLAGMESSLLLKQLERHCQALGVSFPELDKRLQRVAGYHVGLFSGELPFRIEDVFAILYVLREDPGTFFAEELPPNDQGDHPMLRYGLKQPS